MQTITENEKMNHKLAQFCTALKGNRITYENDTKWMVDKLNNINYQVVTTNYIQSKHPHWIGHTVLHFVAEIRNTEAFDILLNHGADFTIKDNSNSTVLHDIIEKHIINISEAYTLSDTFVDSVLSAHLKYSNFDNPLNGNGLSHFHVACAANNVEAVKGFLQNGVSIDQTVKSDSLLFPGFTSLHFATKYCAYEVVDLLIAYGSNEHIKDAKGLTPLHIALERKLKIIDDINANEKLRNSIEKILQLLLNKENNSDLLMIDEWGLCNFHISCALKDSNVAEYILQKVVNINDTVNMDSPLWPGFTALHFTAMCNVNSVKLLMKNGADINMKDAKGVTPFDMCIKRYKVEDIHEIISLSPIWKNVILSDGKTRLSELVFIMRNSDQLAVFLSRLSENISVSKDSALWLGCSPLHLAVIFAKEDANEGMNFQVLSYLFQQHRSLLYSQDVHGCTPLHLAFRLNKKLVVDLLISFLTLYIYSELIDCVDDDGLSFMHIAAAENKTDFLKLLSSIEVNNLNAVYRGKSQFSPTVYSGSTPLHFAVVNESKEAVKFLIKRGADVYAKDVNGMTAVHAIFFSDNDEISRMLVPLLDLQDSVVNDIGLSHLHIACQCQKSRAIKALLRNGADVNRRITCQNNAAVESNISSHLKSFEGETPLIIAYKDCMFENAQLLLDHNADIFVKSAEGVTLVYQVLESCGELMDEFFVTVKNSEDMTARLKTETGMTSLHFACYDLDTKVIKTLLNEGENVNARIPSFSPMLQGYTPLHIVMHVSHTYDHKDIIEIIELLVEAGANVTLQSVKLETPIHIAYKKLSGDLDMEGHTRLNLLLEAQQDFSINPTNDEELSHFHIACTACNANVIEKFLNYDNTYINQRSDYFSSGYSVLHRVTLSSEYVCGILKQLDTIDLLLAHGADINAEDYYGDTPFHQCARFNSIDLFEKLARSGGDLNARNICGETALYYYLESDDVSLDGLKTLVRFGCRLNTYGALSHKGYLGETINALSYDSVWNLILALMGNFKQEMLTNDFGRTAIHNIISTESPGICASQYAELIEEMSRLGCDVDDQDNLGRTALHLAVKFYNAKAISGLLLSGADVNIRDTCGKTALACDSVLCKQCENDETHQDVKKCNHLQILEILAIHVKKLQLSGLDVIKENEEFLSKALEKLKNSTLMMEEFFKELETIKNTKFGSHSLSLYDLLSEYGIVVGYPRMSESKRKDVDKFFSPNKTLKVKEEFPELGGILELQYRKARARSQLVELAKNALTDLTGFRLPQICSEFILILLKNSELKHLIASTISNEGVE